MVEDPLHLHTAARVGNAEHDAGYQAFLGGRAVGSAHQTPIRFVKRPLQHLHGLTSLHTQLRAITGHEVVDDHGQLAATRQLWKTARFITIYSKRMLQRVDPGSVLISGRCLCGILNVLVCVGSLEFFHLLHVGRCIGYSTVYHPLVWLSVHTVPCDGLKIHPCCLPALHSLRGHRRGSGSTMTLSSS